MTSSYRHLDQPIVNVKFYKGDWVGHGFLYKYDGTIRISNKKNYSRYETTPGSRGFRPVLDTG